MSDSAHLSGDTAFFSMASNPTYCPGHGVFVVFFGQVAEELALGTYCIDFEGVTQSPGGQVEG